MYCCVPLCLLTHRQGWTGNRAYRAFSRWADTLKGPTECFFFTSRRDSEQPVAHWFVSCIDSANHPITKRYRRIDEVFFSAYTQRSLHPNFFLVGFSHLSQQLYQEQRGQRARQEEERRGVESVKCLIGTRNGGRHLTYPNVCACHE